MVDAVWSALGLVALVYVFVTRPGSRPLFAAFAIAFAAVTIVILMIGLISL